MSSPQDKKYDIPAGVSNILYHYLLGQNNYDLERLKAQYQAEVKCHLERTEVEQILMTIELIQVDREEEAKYND